MGPSSTDMWFIIIGSIMTIAGCIFYFLMEIWTELRDSDATFPTSVSLMISFGISVATNGMLVGYGLKMSTAMDILVAIIMIISFVWACLNMRTLLKLTSNKQKKA